MKLRKILAVLLLTLVPVLFVSGCDDDSNAKLTGYYTTTATTDYPDAFEISSDATAFTYYGDLEKTTINFAGTITGDVDLTAEEGTFAVEITDGGIWSKTAGKFVAVAWKDFDGTNCQMATPYKVDGTNECDTAAEALSEQTVDNGYFNMFGPYTKQ